MLLFSFFIFLIFDMRQSFNFGLSGITMFFAILSTFILLVCKLIGYCSIGWFWVFFPLLLGIGLVAAFIILWLIFVFIMALISSIR